MTVVLSTPGIVAMSLPKSRSPRRPTLLSVAQLEDRTNPSEFVISGGSVWYPAMAEGAEQITLSEVVTYEDSGEYRWALTFTNTATAYDEYSPSFATLGVATLEVGFPYHNQLDDVLDFETPAYWTATKDPLDPDMNGPAVRWATDSDFIMPGESRTFVFFTLPLPAEWGPGVANSHYDPNVGEIGAQGPALVPKDPPQIEITDQFGDAAGELKVAKWKDDFIPSIVDGKVVAVAFKSPDAANHDFIDWDVDRFNVWVYDLQKWSAKDANQNWANEHIQVRISTTNAPGFFAYDDNPTPVDCVRVPTGTAKGNGWFWSDSQLLVSNEADDLNNRFGVNVSAYLGVDEAVPAGNGLEKNGYTGGRQWQVSDRTHRVALGGTVKADYTFG